MGDGTVGFFNVCYRFKLTALERSEVSRYGYLFFKKCFCSRISTRKLWVFFSESNGPIFYSEKQSTERQVDAWGRGDCVTGPVLTLSGEFSHKKSHRLRGRSWQNGITNLICRPWRVSERSTFKSILWSQTLPPTPPTDQNKLKNCRQ